MRRIRANAIAILTVAWILGTFYYLWQDSKPHSAASSRSPSSSGVGVGGVKSGQRSSGKVELHKEERTVPLLRGRRGPGVPRRDGVRLETFCTREESSGVPHTFGDCRTGNGQDLNGH
ncbi:putative polypeptide N-acetylgalactosaminyltransferase-like protein 1, partial [Ophiophagus hannah]